MAILNMGLTILDQRTDPMTDFEVIFCIIDMLYYLKKTSKHHG